MDQLWCELCNRECGEGLTECEERRALIWRMFRAQDHDTDLTIPLCALLRNLSFTKYFVCTCIQNNVVRNPLFSVLYSECRI